MKEEDLHKDDIIEALPNVHRYDLPLGADTRAMIVVYGELTESCFTRFHEAIQYLEAALLGTKEEKLSTQRRETQNKKIEAKLEMLPEEEKHRYRKIAGETPSDRKVRMRREKMQQHKVTSCDQHPGSKRTKSNRCYDCMMEMIAVREQERKNKIGTMTMESIQ